MREIVTTANWIIVAGYWVLAVQTGVFGLSRSSWWIKTSGVGFFVLCGLTHAHIAWHVSLGEHVPYEELVGTVGVHYPLQAVAVWGFILGVARLANQRGRHRRDKVDSP